MRIDLLYDSRVAIVLRVAVEVAIKCGNRRDFQRWESDCKRRLKRC